MTTDNRTNEPTEAMVEAAAKAHRKHGKGTEYAGIVCRECDEYFEDRAGFEAHRMRAALVAAQGAAPQAEAYDHCCNHPKCPGGSLCCCVSVQRLRDCWNQWREEIAGDSRQAFHDGYQAGQNDPAPWLAAPVLPSSGVDEDKLAKAIDKALIRHGEMIGMSNQERWDARDDIARAVATYLRGES